MSIREIFEQYLHHRYQRDGAVTPGQKLEVLHKVRHDAENGQVPIDDRSVVTLDTSDPSVAAVLRGESVSMGAGAPARRKSPRIKKMSGQKGKLALFLLALLGPILLAFIAFSIRGSNRAKAAAEAEAAAYIATPDMLAMIAMTQTKMARPTSTPEAKPTATLAIATPTMDSVLYAPVAGDAAQEQTNPASIEVGGRLFILQKGEIDRKTGLWDPQQPEWLGETELRKVFALPRAFLEDAGIVPGGHIMLRLRNGEMIDYLITTILRIPMNQIEVLKSNSPSAVILTIDDQGQGQDPTLERLVIVGEIPVPDQPRELTENKPLSAAIRDGVEGAARLRAEPSLDGEVVELLPIDTVLSVPYPLQRMEKDGLTWVYVHSALGSGWLAEDLIIYRP